MNDTPPPDATVPPAPSGGRKDDNARERLLRAGAAEFLAKGFAKARLANIVRAAGVTTGPLYWYFRDKEDLFGALVSDAYDAALALLDGFLASYRALEDANKTREAIRGGRSYACGLASLVFSRKKAFRLLVEDRAVGTRWNGLPRLLAEREIDEEWVWMDDSQKNVPGDPFPRESLVDLLHGTIEALFKAVFRAKSRDEVASVAEKNHAFYVAGCCAVLGLGTDDAPTPGSSGASPPPV